MYFESPQTQLRIKARQYLPAPPLHNSNHTEPPFPLFPDPLLSLTSKSWVLYHNEVVWLCSQGLLAFWVRRYFSIRIYKHFLELVSFTILLPVAKSIWEKGTLPWSSQNISCRISTVQKSHSVSRQGRWKCYCPVRCQFFGEEPGSPILSQLAQSEALSYCSLLQSSSTQFLHRFLSATLSWYLVFGMLQSFLPLLLHSMWIFFTSSGRSWYSYYRFSTSASFFYLCKY